MLLSVEDTENRAKVKLQRAVEEVKKLLIPADGEDELKKRQLMELAIINGTYRDSNAKVAAVAGLFEIKKKIQIGSCTAGSNLLDSKECANPFSLFIIIEMHNF